MSYTFTNPSLCISLIPNFKPNYIYPINTVLILATNFIKYCIRTNLINPSPIRHWNFFFNECPFWRNYSYSNTKQYKHSSLSSPNIGPTVLYKLVSCLTKVPFYDHYGSIQIDDIAMGSPLSHIWHNFYMAYKENKIFNFTTYTI